MYYRHFRLGQNAADRLVSWQQCTRFILLNDFKKRVSVLYQIIWSIPNMQTLTESPCQFQDYFGASFRYSSPSLMTLRKRRRAPRSLVRPSARHSRSSKTRTAIVPLFIWTALSRCAQPNPG